MSWFRAGHRSDRVAEHRRLAIAACADEAPVLASSTIVSTGRRRRDLHRRDLRRRRRRHRRRSPPPPPPPPPAVATATGTAAPGGPLLRFIHLERPAVQHRAVEYRYRAVRA